MRLRLRKQNNKINMNRQEIIHLALENLEKKAQIKAKWIPSTKSKLDGKLILKIEKTHTEYNVVIKNELRSHHLPQIELLNKENPPFMLVAGRLFPTIKEQLRQGNIAYLEANGNMFIKSKSNLIWMDGSDPIRLKNETESRAFTKTGLKVVLLFLLDEKWLNKTYRQIADQAGTTIGNITHIFNGLKKESLLLSLSKKEYKLNNKTLLFDKWIAAYELKLKPALKIGTFRFLKEEDFLNWKNVHLQKEKSYWGGEPAGDLLTNYLRPAELTLYTTESRNDLIKNYKLIPDDKGNVKVYQKFWQENEMPPILVYADLINTKDRRCFETAQKIYDEYLQN
jgi:hypothetical protein